MIDLVLESFPKAPQSESCKSDCAPKSNEIGEANIAGIKLFRLSLLFEGTNENIAW